ncbi:hypothetical protein EVAR_83028_1 [Eumeta japonica]|uniref:Uncharacterized protein n=1 Tax=Eumeta variegata TaxID=151549 RepID=A0A4C1VMG8_EUMVA|nr:hypothetical protein EVAR_83028_1 [Eumeta japonica]
MKKHQNYKQRKIINKGNEEEDRLIALITIEGRGDATDHSPNGVAADPSNLGCLREGSAAQTAAPRRRACCGSPRLGAGESF